MRGALASFQRRYGLVLMLKRRRVSTGKLQKILLAQNQRSAQNRPEDGDHSVFQLHSA